MSLEQFKDVDLTTMSKEQLFLYQKTLENELNKVYHQNNSLKATNLTREYLIEKVTTLNSDNFTIEEPSDFYFEKLIEDGYFYVKFYRYLNHTSTQSIKGYLKIVGVKDPYGVITDITTDKLLIEMTKQLVMYNPKRLVTQSRSSRNYNTLDQPTLVLETTLGGFMKPDELKDIIDTIVNDTTITYK